jgi:hypothetical protein
VLVVDEQLGKENWLSQHKGSIDRVSIIGHLNGEDESEVDEILFQ